jgi:hypothetical protein
MCLITEKWVILTFGEISSITSTEVCVLSMKKGNQSDLLTQQSPSVRETPKGSHFVRFSAIIEEEEVYYD